MTSPAPNPAARLGVFLAVTAIALSALVWAQRARLAWQVTHVAPGLAETSGFEEETHFALWRVLHGQPLFLDETKPPFAAAYFNWLFYYSYAAPLVPFAPLQNGTPLVRVARVLTAGAALTGAVLLLAHFRRAATRPLIAAAFAAFLFGGPLVGWWAHTARPDVAALVADVAAATLFLRYYASRPWRATLLALVACYIAWSFKQTYVLTLGGILLFLLLRRRWRQAATLTFGTVALWALTFLLLGPDYRLVQATNAAGSEFYAALGLEYAVRMLAKSAPLWIASAGVIIIMIRGLPAPSHLPSPASPIRDARLLGLCVLGVATPLAFLGSCKLGANEYYYFPATLGLALLAGTLPANHALALTALATIVAMHVATLTGSLGRLDLSPQTRTLAERWAVYQTLPEPRFSDDTRLNQPWLNPQSPPFVLSYNYRQHRRTGQRLADNGIAGLVERGFFASLLVPARAVELHGGRLDHYVPGETVSGMTVYRRRPSTSTP